MRNKIIGSICLIFVLTMNSFVFANNRPGVFTISLGNGYYHFDTKRKLENTYSQNIAFDYNFNRAVSIEGLIGLLNTDTTRENINPNVGAHGYLYTIDGLYHFRPYQFVEPYVLGGIGAVGLKPNGIDSKYQGNLNAGIGSQFFIDRSIALKLEARDVYTMIGGKNDYLINAGISFLFDTCFK